MKIDDKLSVFLLQVVFGQLEISQPVDKLRRKKPLFAIERVPGEPDSLLLCDTNGAGMIELFP